MTFEFPDETIEKLILKKSLTDKKYLGKISEVFDSRWFKSETVKTILKLGIKFYRKYDKIPDDNVLNILAKKYTENHDDVKLSDISQELTSLKDLGIDCNSDVARKNIDDFITDRGFYYSIIDRADDIMVKHNVDDCISQIEKIKKIATTDTDIGMDYFTPEGMKEHWNYLLNPEAKIPTLFPGLDRYMCGGVLKDGKDLTCFVAQAGLGKSLFLSNLAVNFLKQNLSVVVISLEMSENVYAKRFTAHISNSNINTLAQNKDSAYKAVTDFYSSHPNCNLIIKEYPPKTINAKDIENYLENLKAAGKKIDVIIIDYLNLVLSNSKRDTMYEAVQEVSESLRAISYKFNAPVITATQATTDGMNNEDIGMEHVSESRGICHTVDQLFALYALDDDREHGQINLKILKNRAGGEVGKKLIFKVSPNKSLLLSDITFNPQAGINDEPTESEQILNNLDEVESDINNI